MVVCAGPPREYADHLPGAARPGARRRHAGLPRRCSRAAAIADRTARDPQTVAWREIARAVREDETLLSAVLPIGAGLLVATKPQLTPLRHTELYDHRGGDSPADATVAAGVQHGGGLGRRSS